MGKGHAWSEPNKPPQLIRGEFPDHQDVLKIERVAAKFATPAEEAEARKAELVAMEKGNKQVRYLCCLGESVDVIVHVLQLVCSKFNIISLSFQEDLPPTEETADSSAADSVSTDSGAADSGAADSCAEPISATVPVEATQSSVDEGAVSGASGVESFQSPRAKSGKRNSVLANNPELLNTLNKMFSSPAGSNLGAVTGPSAITTANRRATIAPRKLFPAESAAATETSEPVAPKVKIVKKTQSKLLQVSFLCCCHLCKVVTRLLRRDCSTLWVTTPPALSQKALPCHF